MPPFVVSSRLQLPHHLQQCQFLGFVIKKPVLGHSHPLHPAKRADGRMNGFLCLPSLFRRPRHLWHERTTSQPRFAFCLRESRNLLWSPVLSEEIKVFQFSSISRVASPFLRVVPPLLSPCIPTVVRFAGLPRLPVRCRSAQGLVRLQKIDGDGDALQNGRHC